MSTCKCVLRDNDREAMLLALYEEHDDFLRRMGCLLCGSWDLSEDLVQELWLRVWKYPDSLQDPAAARGWLMTILRREWARYLGRRFHKSECEWRDGIVDATQPCNSENVVLLDQVIGSMNCEQRRLFDLCLVDGVSYATASRQLNMPAGTLGTRLHRLRQQMGERFGADAKAA